MDATPSVLSHEYWLNRWKDETAHWHKTEVNSFLEKQWPQLVTSQDPSSLNVFFPLCGKSIDMAWVYNKGCTVYGIDICEDAVGEFGQDCGIELIKTNVAVGDGTAKLYQTEDKRLNIYVFDLFQIENLTPIKFDIIVDRGSLTAINHDDRQSYLDLICRLSKPITKWLVQTFHYDPVQHHGPPFNFTDDEFEAFLSSKFNTELIEYSEYKTLSAEHLDLMFQRITLHTPK